MTLPPRLSIRLAAGFLAVAVAGCASVPYVGQGPHPQIQRGRPCLPIDAVGNVLALPAKVFLFDWHFADHTFSARNEALVVEFVEQYPKEVGETQVQLNQYAPHHDLARLMKNHNVAWPYRITIGLLSTLVMDVMLPGRVMPWGDYYNPWTNTAHIYSDHPAVALHELGHSYDINRRRYKGSYAFARMLPFVNLYQEWEASDAAIDHFIETKNRTEELRAYKILYPAYGTYMGSYLPFFGSIVGLAVGHVWGRTKAYDRARFYERMDEASSSVARPAETSVTVPDVTP